MRICEVRRVDRIHFLRVFISLIPDDSLPAAAGPSSFVLVCSAVSLQIGQ